MAAIERIGGAGRFKCCLLAVEAVIDLKLRVDARIGEPGIALTLADILLLAAIDVDDTEECKLARLVHDHAVVEIFEFGLAWLAREHCDLGAERSGNLWQR